MSAPRVLQVYHNLRPILPCLCSSIQPVRYKKGAGRYKTPTVAKEKEKWVPLSKREKVKEKVMPKNWDTKFMTRVPTDDVWIRSQYPPQPIAFREAIERHMEFVAAPDMINKPDAVVHMKAWLDMRTKKKTKFMGNISSSVILPHNFDDGQVNRVVVFCRTEEEQQRAMELGAVAAGYAELIRNLASGDIGPDDYEHAICLHDVLPELTGLRKYMKDKFPNKGKGTLGDDLDAMQIRFQDGKMYTSTKESDSVGYVEVKLGTLSMGPDKLEDNFKAYVDVISSQRSVDLGPFITKAILTCPPSIEKFHINPDQLRIKKKVTAKKAQKNKVVEEEREDESEVVAASL